MRSKSARFMETDTSQITTMYFSLPRRQTSYKKYTKKNHIKVIIRAI